jgi:hypothetical protein
MRTGASCAKAGATAAAASATSAARLMKLEIPIVFSFGLSRLCAAGRYISFGFLVLYDRTAVHARQFSGSHAAAPLW